VNQASSLNLVTNAVIVWNTVSMAEAVAQLKREGYPIQESDLAHIWPTRYEHINVYLTFRTLFRPSDAIFEGPRVESGAEAIYRSLHAL
jgi:hypothetical protein